MILANAVRGTKVWGEDLGKYATAGTTEGGRKGG